MKQQPSHQAKKTQTQKNTFIGHYQDAPGYMKDNQHITHGYRIGFDSPRKIFRSLFMVHNESVNIWTHFLPALILICFTIYMLVFVGPATIIHDFNVGRQKLSTGIKQYSQALNNLTFIIKMKSFQTQTGREMDELKRTMINTYSNFQNNLKQWNKYASYQFSNIQTQVQNSFHNQLAEMQSLKQDFQRVFVPYVVSQLKGTIDPKHLEMLTTKLNKIKQNLDSSRFDYIDLQSKIPNPNLVSRWPVFVFLFSAAICLLCSTSFHLFYPMSGKSYQVFSRLDYAGINVLISGSSFPALYYGMYCNFSLVVFYLIFICALGLTLFVVTLFQYLHRPQNLTLKSLAYGGFGVSLIIPLGHAVINQIVFNNYGDNFSMKGSLIYYVFVGVFYLFGLYVYTVRCPERHYTPGKFNVCGNSHQIWHIFVLLGILATYMGALQNLQTRKLYQCPLNP